jgi:hypothetical protein
VDRKDMLRLFEAHREAEAARDIDAILETFVPEPFLETIPLGLRSEGRDAVRAAYAQQFFTAFRTWPRRTKARPSARTSSPSGAHCTEAAVASGSGFRPAEAASPFPSPTSSPLATLCEQARLPLEQVRAAAAERRRAAATPV